ncbi:peptide ABC transporter substrate-binding protein [Kamptonema cortianum]|nr:peptide ABC transporter substrate-binding protein [Kamptonema cortianum]
MFRGFRWQLGALILAAIIFAVSLAIRSAEQPGVIEPTPIPATTAPTQETVVVPSVEPALTPQPTRTPVTQDGIPTYREALIGSVSRLNPLFAAINPAERDITSLIFEGLTRTNAYGEPVAALAENWVISSDGLEYVITLRSDVRWQDGTPFSAADVIYTMSLLRAPDFPGSEELRTFWSTVETEQLSDRIIRFRLTQPLGTFLDKLRIGILPEHALRGTTAAQLASHPFNLTPIGTGPYQLEAIRTGSDGQIAQVDLRVAPVYRERRDGQAPYLLERMRFAIYDTFEAALTALQNAEVDGLAARNVYERRPLFNLANTADLLVNNQLENTLGAVIFNWQSETLPYFREQRIRVALETGIDRTSIVERRLANTALEADSPLMPGSWAYLADLPWPAYNTALARNLLTQGLDRVGRLEPTPEPEESAETTGTPAEFSFTILVPDDPSLINVAEEIATQWSQLNLEIRVESVSAAAFAERLDRGTFDVAIVEYALGESADPDVYAFWHQGQYPDGRNYGGVDDRRISELLERARRDAYGINRAQDYHEFQRVFVERAIALPLYYPLYTYVTSARVSGVQLGFIGSPSDRFRNIGEWSVN